MSKTSKVTTSKSKSASAGADKHAERNAASKRDPEASSRPEQCFVPEGETVSVGKGSHVYLVDGSGYIFRAFHALPPLTRPSDGLPVGAVHGFCQMLWKLLGDSKLADKPTHVAVVFDHSAKTFRNNIYDQYKANRPPPPEELVPQFPLIRDAVKAFNVACIEQKGYEADDLIATYARQAVEAGGDVTIVSSDKDLMQLIQPGIVMFDGMKNKKIGPDEVREKFGVPPEKVVDVQALAGDSTDNVPGVPGIGVKTAAELINTYEDLDTLLERAEEIKQPKRREKLIEFADQARIWCALRRTCR
jgi:DNA polymerase-1